MGWGVALMCKGLGSILSTEVKVSSLHPAAGYWYGIELDQPTGKHDGSVFGVRYFTCAPRHGVFAPASRIQR